jgi:plastocyanin
MTVSQKISKIAYVFTIALFAIVAFTYAAPTTEAYDMYYDDYFGGYDDYGYNDYDYGYNDYDYGYDDYGYNDYDYGYNDYDYGYDDYAYDDCNSGCGGSNNYYGYGSNGYGYYDDEWDCWGGCGSGNNSGGYSNSVNVVNDIYNNNTNEVIVDLSDYEDNDDDDLSAVCYANAYSVDQGDTVSWTVNASGGNSNYSYAWSGSDGLNGSGRTVTIRYNQYGTKTASVVVRSGNDSVNVNCGTVYVERDHNNNDNDNDDEDFDVVCRPNKSRVEEGDTVRWEAEVDGVDEDDVDFDWSGDADGDDQEVTERYNREGTYEARVRATYRGQTETDECTVRVEDEDNDNNVTLISNPPSGNLASLNSVYLSQVPYTGAGDGMKLAAIITSLLLLSLGGAYMIVTRKAKGDRKAFLARFKAENLAKTA